MDKNRKNKVLITKCVNEIMYIDYLTAVKITFQKKSQYYFKNGLSY